jgi:hypothetical protein
LAASRPVILFLADYGGAAQDNPGKMLKVVVAGSWNWNSSSVSVALIFAS